MFNTKNNYVLLVLLHVFIGSILWILPSLSTLFGLLIILVGGYRILNKPDSKGLLPIFFSAYIVGIEVLLRMTSSLLFWEFGKYAVIFFLLLGILRKNHLVNLYPPIVLYFLFLLPSVCLVPLDSFNLWRQSVAFNLSGPACLMVSSIYFYNLEISMDDVKKMLLFAILPIFSMAIFIILKMPNFASYHFMPFSDPTTSGGYGPNQVSTIFGFGFAILAYSQIMKNYIFRSRTIDILFLTIFIGLGLITFSRGGMISAIIAFSLAVSYYFFHGQRKMQLFFKGAGLLVAVLVTWFYIVNITEGVISQRYGLTGETYGEKLILDMTGRVLIYGIDLNIFYDNFFTGVGPGQANSLRELYGYGKTVAAHTEYSRMLAEHGILGLFSLTVLLFLPILRFLSAQSLRSKFIIILFGFLALLPMGHSAMRLAMSPFIYGLLFPKYTD